MQMITALDVFLLDHTYGMGLFAFINPTGLILASLAIVNIGYDKWLKFILLRHGQKHLMNTVSLLFSSK